MAKMGKRSRTERREAARGAVKLARVRMKLAALESGGAPDRPIEVTSASIIEPHASSMACVACDSQGLRVEEHVAQTFERERAERAEGGEGEPARRVRVVHARCSRCGTRREIYFRIGTELPS